MKTNKNLKRVSTLAMLLLATWIIPACSGGGTDLSVSLARQVGICFGRVIDRSTRAGIAGATVEIFAGAIPSSEINESDSAGDETNFVARTTTAADDADTTLFDESGMFRIDNLPTGDGTGYRVRIGATNYATIQTLCTFAVTSSDNTPIAEDLGDLLMVRGASVAVNVVNFNTGAGIAGCPVYALPAGSDEPGGSGSQSTSVMGGIEVSGTTDSSGTVTLAGINPLIDYTIVVPACDIDADGSYDFRTAVPAFDSAIDSASQFTVAVIAAEVDDTPALVASSCGQFSPTEDAGMPGCGVAANGTLTFVFNYPILGIETGALSLLLNTEALFTDSSVAGGILGASAVDFDGDETADTGTVAAFTTSLAANNTVLTVTPAVALSANGLYTLDGAITASVPGAGAVGDILSQNFSTLLGALMGNELIYAFPASDTAIADPTVDNYNGDDDGVGVAAICLEFDELVVGSAQLTAFTAAGTAVVPVPTAFDLSTGFLINEGDNAAGCGFGLAGCPASTDGTCVGAADETEAIKYVVPLGAILPGGGVDHTAASTNTITVFVDAIDYAGNTLRKVLTLEVQ